MRGRLLAIAAIMAISSLWTPRSDAIINGYLLSGPPYRWVIAIHFTGSIYAHCSGSLIADEWVLTNKHCVEDPYGYEITIVDYPSDFDFVKYSQSPEDLITDYAFEKITSSVYNRFVLDRVRATRVYLHPRTDMALVKLERKPNHVGDLPTMITPNEAKELRGTRDRNLRVAAAGFGTNGIEETEISTFGLLRLFYYTALDPYSDLIPSFPPTGSYYVSYPVKGNGSRQYFYFGDSGSPLMAIWKGRWRLIGINSAIRFGIINNLKKNLDVTRRPRVLYSLKIDRYLCTLLRNLDEPLVIPGYEECAVRSGTF